MKYLKTIITTAILSLVVSTQAYAFDTAAFTCALSLMALDKENTKMQNSDTYVPPKSVTDEVKKQMDHGLTLLEKAENGEIPMSKGAYKCIYEFVGRAGPFLEEAWTYQCDADPQCQPE